MAVKFLDLSGLRYFWTKIKEKLSNIELQVGELDKQVDSRIGAAVSKVDISNSQIGKRLTVLEESANLSGNIVFDYEIGAISTSTGENAASSNRIRSTNYIANKYVPINLEIVGNVKVMAVYYKSDYTPYGNSGWRTESSEFAIGGNTDVAYMRIFAGFTDDSAITSVDNIKNEFSLRYADSSMRYNGIVLAGGRTSFNDCKENGYYSFTLASVADIADSPEGLNAGGIITVQNFAAKSVRFQEITTSTGKKYFRFNDNEFKDTSATSANGSGAKWYALGDSITQGYYSYLDSSGSPAIAVTSDCWTRSVAAAKNYVLTNYGVGGSGYVHNGTVLDKLNAREHVDTIDFSGADIVTLAYGVNDWKYNEPLGAFDDNVQSGGTFYSNMRYVIEKILGDNPLCKIVVITPINCSAYGTQDGNWGIGHSFANNGTLEDIFNAEKTVADYYGLELVDMTHDSCVNRLTAPRILIDGVHPSLDGHKAMGREIADKINFW